MHTWSWSSSCAITGRLDEDIEQLGDLITTLGALDVFVLPPRAASNLIEARERAFFAAKAAGANEIIDTVVPRAQIPEFLAKVSGNCAGRAPMVIGCGHAGDGNVHLSVFQSDPERLDAGAPRASSPQAPRSAARYPANTASAPTSAATSWRSRTRPSWR